MQRNLPDLASTLVRPPSFGSSSISSYPLLDERTPTERYSREFESARELAELRQQNKQLGEAVTWILETLNGRVDEQEAWQVQRTQPLQSLSYVRDVLRGQIDEIDERRLWGEEEFKRRWETRETSPSVTTTRSDNRRPTLNTPIPSSVNETLRGFISSHAARAVSATPDHSRSASTGAPVVSRTPVRVSANNPFQRVSNGRNVAHAANRTVVGSASDGSPVQQQHDPLGVLR